VTTRRWILPVFYAVAIFGLSSIEYIPDVGQPENSDKVAHFLLYYFFTASIYWALTPRLTRPRAALAAAIIAAAYGATDEFHQWFVPGREMSIYDWVADAAGAFVWSALMWIASRALDRRSKTGARPQEPA
jgi:VanZ family protein